MTSSLAVLYFTAVLAIPVSCMQFITLTFHDKLIQGVLRANIGLSFTVLYSVEDGGTCSPEKLFGICILIRWFCTRSYHQPPYLFCFKLSVITDLLVPMCYDCYLFCAELIFNI